MKYRHYIFVLLALFGVGATPAHAAPASLSIYPATGVYPIGDPFSIEVRIDTGGTTIGTADATITYEPDDLAYVSMADDGSVMSRILVDSTTVPGRIDISGFIEHTKPAFSGTNGLLVRLTFIPVRNVATEVRFAQGAATPPLTLNASVGSLANVLSNLRSATYTLVPKEIIPAATVAGAYSNSGALFPITPLPVLEEGAWFGTTSVKLFFSVPEGAGEMRTAISRDPNAQPDKAHPIPVNSVFLTDLTEGNNYFILQFKYADTWGEAIRHPVPVDLTPPGTIAVTEAERADPADPRVAFEVEAIDALSGVIRYEMSIDGGDPEPWDGNGAYQPDELDSGEHILTVTAYDRAGNSASEDVVFLVKSLEPPVLTDAPNHVLTGDSITVRGTTYPDAEVRVFTSFNDEEAAERTIRSDGAGSFTTTLTDGARAGKYTVWFQVTDARGATSPLSIKRSVEVSQPYIMLFGKVAVTYLSIIIPLLGLIVLLILVVWLGYTFLRGYRTRVRRETTEAYDVVNEEFASLRDDLRKQIGMLERAHQARELTREEMRIFTELSKKLDYIERHIEEEIDDIAERTDAVVHGTVPAAPADVAPHVPVSTPAAPPPATGHTVHLTRRG